MRTSEKTSEKTATPDLSKRVLDNRKDGDRIEAMAREHAAKVGASVAATLGAEYQPMAEALVLGLAARTATVRDEMVAGDVAHTIELADDAPPRNDRDRFEAETRAAIVDVRERVVGMYGQGILSTMLLASAAPKDPKQLVTFATRAADVIAKMAPDSFPESKIEGGKPSPKKWAALLRKPVEELDKALKTIDREVAEAVTTQAERAQKIAAFETFAPRARDLLEGFLRFGGMDAEADRIARPVASAASAPSAGDAPTDGAPVAADPTQPK